MIELIKTDTFDRWLRSLRDTQARAKIAAVSGALASATLVM